MSPTVPSVFLPTDEIAIKHQRKILTSFFGWAWPLRLVLAAPLTQS